MGGSKYRLLILAPIIFLWASCTTHAFGAEIHVKAEVNEEQNTQRLYVSIEGDLRKGDAARFKQLVGSLIEDRPDHHADFVIVSLKGEGGDLKEALEIAKFIMTNKMATVVSDGNRCLSACAFVFLSGADQQPALAPLLFHDTDLAAAKAERTSPVAATEPSDAVKAKKATRRSADGQRVMSFADLVAHLETLVRNTMRVPARPKHRFTLHSRPTTLQEAAFALLGLDPVRVQ
jgi:hypothetical protein